jgi:hypothetical protein
MFLNYLKKATRTNNHFDYEELLETIGNELDEISKDPYESVALEYFDLKSWLTSKIKRKSFSEVTRTAYNKTIQMV